MKMDDSMDGSVNNPDTKLLLCHTKLMDAERVNLAW